MKYNSTVNDMHQIWALDNNIRVSNGNKKNKKETSEVMLREKR
jgi:hypothetical protein